MIVKLIIMVIITNLNHQWIHIEFLEDVGVSDATFYKGKCETILSVQSPDEGTSFAVVADDGFISQTWLVHFATRGDVMVKL